MNGGYFYLSIKYRRDKHSISRTLLAFRAELIKIEKGEGLVYRLLSNHALSVELKNNILFVTATDAVNTELKELISVVVALSNYCELVHRVD